MALGAQEPYQAKRASDDYENQVGTLTEPLTSTPMQIGTGAGVVRRLHLDNSRVTATTYFKMYDAASPTYASHPCVVIPVPANTKVAVHFPVGRFAATGKPRGLSFTTKIWVAASSAKTPTESDPATAFIGWVCWGDYSA